MQNKRKLYGYLAIITADILWGMSFVWTKELLQNGIPVFTILLGRMIVASSVLLLLFKITGKLENIRRKDFSLFFLLALFQPFLYFIGENYGLKYASPSIGAAVVALVPVAQTLSLHLFYKENIRATVFLGTAVSAIGIAIMSFSSQTADLSMKGLLLLLLAVVSAAMYGTILQKILKKGYGPVTITTAQNMISIIYYLPCFLVFDLNTVTSLQWNAQSVINILILGVLCSAGAFALYSTAAKLISVAGIAVFTNVIPVVTLAMSVLLGVELLNVRKTVGILIVIVGVLVSQFVFSGKKKSETENKNLNIKETKTN
ncbi:MAG: DMT family transporter [Bacteroidales bacterium]|nr:DMT family transporter [Bacteroidales bacterium]